MKKKKLQAEFLKESVKEIFVGIRVLCFWFSTGRRRLCSCSRAAGRHCLCSCSRVGRRRLCSCSRVGQRRFCSCSPAGRRRLCSCSRAGQCHLSCSCHPFPPIFTLFHTVRHYHCSKLTLCPPHNLCSVLSAGVSGSGATSF
uniref:Uncharacterized protein n=1 Tax=Stegastes partitus TaxID=144197 RepID=A0A3B5AQZ5_9TELE